MNILHKTHYDFLQHAHRAHHGHLDHKNQLSQLLIRKDN